MGRRCVGVSLHIPLVSPETGQGIGAAPAQHLPAGSMNGVAWGDDRAPAHRLTRRFRARPFGSPSRPSPVESGGCA